MADDIGVAVDDALSILIIALRTIVLLGDSFWFRRSGIFTLILMLKFCDVDFCHQFIYFGSDVLVF